MVRVALVLPALLYADLSLGQTVWNVPAFASIQAAIAAASPGDILVLTNAGGYPDYVGFVLDKGLTIRGNGARIGGDPSGSIPSSTITINVPAGQVAHLERLECTYSYSPIGSVGGAKVVVQGGTVRFEQCTILRQNYEDAMTISDANVTVVDSSIHHIGSLGAARGLVATNSNVTLRGCSVRGSDDACHPWYGCGVGWSEAESAAEITSSMLHAEGTTFRGGNHVNAAVAGNGGAALVATGSRVWLAGCQLIGGALGATALVNNGPSTVELRQTSLQGGSPSGVPSTGPVDPTAPLLRLELAPPWQRGVTTTLTCRGDANAVFGLCLAPDVTPTTLAFLVEPVWALTGTAIQVGVLDVAGLATFPVAVPNVASLQHRTVWCQAASGLVFPLRASTIAGGVIR
ncbi:MAG: right-handed parallel beta-helix repeat-containing protein [Planctomycetota bacterium]